MSETIGPSNSFLDRERESERHIDPVRYENKISLNLTTTTKCSRIFFPKKKVYWPTDLKFELNFFRFGLVWVSEQHPHLTFHLKNMNEWSMVVVVVVVGKNDKCWSKSFSYNVGYKLSNKKPKGISSSCFFTFHFIKSNQRSIISLANQTKNTMS